MEETYFDEGPAVNFERATLEIVKDPNGQDYNHSVSKNEISAADGNLDSSKKSPKIATSTRDISNVPFRHIDVHTFFSNRNEVVERALKDCKENLMKEEEIIGNWLLTKISLWDAERERLMLLTKKSLYSVKYDFISLKILKFNRIPLSEIDTVVAGELIYPRSSLAPRLHGLAEGLSSMIHCAVRRDWSFFTSLNGLTQFEPRKRYMSGVRLMWNKGQPLPLKTKWNPFAGNIPWLTYASHPLFWYKGNEIDKARFDVEGFHTTILSLLSEECNVVNGAIIIENYFGLGALLHNRNGLGFFKIRGKVSF